MARTPIDAYQRGTGKRFNFEARARMQTTDTNKILMSLLMVLLLTKGLGVFTSALFSPPSEIKGGYALPAGGADAAAKPADAPKQVPLPDLLAKADLKKGEADVRVCQACHSFEKGAGAKVGPPLYGVIGRPKGSVAGFNYSDGMKAKGGNWTYEDINTFITKPSAFVAGTKMTYPGESDPQKRADILDYLQSDSDDKVPFPK
jgi:cytochrome c